MKLHPIAIAIPLFFLAIAVEALAARRRRLTVLHFTDAITDLSCGIGNQAIALVVSLALLSLYGAVHVRWSVLHFGPGSAWPWLIAFVGVDFLYYWWHRLSHEVNVLWAVHVVHHQSEDYNLAVALRQPYFGGFTIFPFYLPLAFLGVPPMTYAVTASLSLLYQFWIHTELIDRFTAPIEWLLNTPSHHRAHHGINPEYLDKNYGATLIVWDRLFGTFEPERRPVVYGVTEPLKSFNPVWANLQYFSEIGLVAGRSERRGRLGRALAARPGQDVDTGKIKTPPLVDRETFLKQVAPPMTRVVRLWVALQLGLVSFALMALLLYVEVLPRRALCASAVLIVLATLAWGGIQERRRWGWPLEGVRLVASVLLVVWLKVG